MSKKNNQGSSIRLGRPEDQELPDVGHAGVWVGGVEGGGGGGREKVVL